MKKMSKKHNWLDIESFCEIHNYTPNNIHCKRFNGSDTFIKVDGNRTYIDELSLIRRKQFQKKIWLDSHDYYYEFMEYFPSESAFARFLGKYYPLGNNNWNEFLSKQLFSLPTDRLFEYRVPDRLWAFYRICRFTTRKIERLW